ncbi:hypothetical protein SAMD00019534_086860 [Acytostelium subglobosum LB1]|uniref:hypothetical protein n=1 Tax=Acytostelium subglobosum LB1 TaxID=1410327 RepID=UPI000644F9BD|nr:hypothetical protein SAMD00019534_086860 [Acytostelium subglobosum LB1]GAM25511.1 hypothetical protein SAMD00019534_086860 [Acytostelium subglobosum LB1]|eukprot:XP_012751497.1 hypothetical protein SAMD00019534_086860 [Acytostelium subglobosum LB1]
MKAIEDGEYDVALGTTFTEPTREQYHTLLFNIKPNSLDTTKPGFIRSNQGHISVQYHNQNNPNEMIKYEGPLGKKAQNNTVECLLIFDNGVFRLERLSSSSHLKKQSVGGPPPSINDPIYNEVTSLSTSMQSSSIHSSSSKKKMEAEEVFPSQYLKKQKKNEPDTFTPPPMSAPSELPTTSSSRRSRSSANSTRAQPPPMSNTPSSSASLPHRHGSSSGSSHSSHSKHSSSAKTSTPHDLSISDEFDDFAKELEDINKDEIDASMEDIDWAEYPVGGEAGGHASLTTSSDMNDILSQDMKILDSPLETDISTTIGGRNTNSKTIAPPVLVTTVNPPGFAGFKAGGNGAAPKVHHQMAQKQPPPGVHYHSDHSDTSESDSESVSSSYSSSDSESSSDA